MSITLPIIDFHCDLLAYLQSQVAASPYHPEVNCSIPQLKEGNVCSQVLAIYAQGEDPHALANGLKQIEILKNLGTVCPEVFLSTKKMNDKEYPRQPIKLLAAIEGMAAVSGADEPLEMAFARLEELNHDVCRLVYLSLTWNEENRFGGGALTDVGLKQDGRRLLDWMAGKGIAIDFSHTSDRLAEEILEYRASKGLDVPILASHSNCRVVCNEKRNLPDHLIRAIFEEDGVVGLNLVKRFVGSRPELIADHFSHLLELGGENHIVFGADFFYGQDPRDPYYKPLDEQYHTPYTNASCYPTLLGFLQKKLQCSTPLLEAVAWKNAARFLSATEQYP